MKVYERNLKEFINKGFKVSLVPHTELLYTITLLKDDFVFIVNNSRGKMKMYKLNAAVNLLKSLDCINFKILG